VAVELTVVAPSLGTLEGVSIPRDALSKLTAEDAAGPLALAVEALGAASAGAGPSSSPGTTAQRLVAVPARASKGPVRISYEIAASTDVRASASTVVAGEDRFRALGESLVLLPTAIADTPVELTVAIDGAALRAPDAASSFGLGASRTRTARPRALVHAAFLAGSLGRAAFDAGLERDEAAWLGYTAFDPRPVAAEVAQVRTALRELWKGGGDDAFAFLFVSSARPSGAWATIPRASSLLLHLGPAEGWGAPLRVAVTQRLMQPWIGGELRIGSDEVDGAWFTDGVARVLAAHVLRDLELITPNDALAVVHGLFSMQATSPHRGKGSRELAASWRADPTARAHVTALGALHAVHVTALLARKKGARPLTAIVLELLQKARAEHGTFPASAWTEALGKELGPEGARAFDDDVVAGREVVLPAGALGPCFTSRPGEYVAFELGFDVRATTDSATRAIVGLDPKGPAAKAGVREGDVLEEAVYEDGVPDRPAKLSLLRAGTKVDVKYVPAGVRRAGQVFSRVPGVRDDACGPVL
jgi:hypothetical protein